MGPMLYAEDEGEVFLGKSMSKASHMSDDTARAIDAEVKSFIDSNYDRAYKILEENIDILHSMKDALMKYETIDAKQIDDLMARRDVRPPADWDDRAPKGGDYPPGGKPAREGEITDDGLDKPPVGKPGDLPG